MGQHDIRIKVTPICHWWNPPAIQVAVKHMHTFKDHHVFSTVVNVSERFSRNIEANASEFPEYSEEMCPCYLHLLGGQEQVIVWT